MHALLGGKKRDKVEVYASLLAYGGKLDDVKRNTARALERGYRQIKLHEKTTEAVAASREAAGAKTPLMVDTNCAWLPADAHDAVMAMKPYDPLWVEEPIWPAEDVDALGQVAQGDRRAARGGRERDRHARIRAAGGGRDRLRAAERREARPHRAMGDLPHRPRRPARPACRIRRISAPAISRPCISSPRSRRRSRSSASSAISAMCLMRKSVPIENGVVQIPDMPGLGPDPDEELLTRFKL